MDTSVAAVWAGCAGKPRSSIPMPKAGDMEKVTTMAFHFVAIADQCHRNAARANNTQVGPHPRGALRAFEANPSPTSSSSLTFGESQAAVRLRRDRACRCERRL